MSHKPVSAKKSRTDPQERALQNYRVQLEKTKLGGVNTATENEKSSIKKLNAETKLLKINRKTKRFDPQERAMWNHQVQLETQKAESKKRNRQPLEQERLAAEGVKIPSDIAIPIGTDTVLAQTTKRQMGRERERIERVDYQPSLQRESQTATTLSSLTLQSTKLADPVPVVAKKSVRIANFSHSGFVRFVTAIVVPAYILVLITHPIGQKFVKGIWYVFAKYQLQGLFALCSGAAPVAVGLVLFKVFFDRGESSETWISMMGVLLLSLTLIVAALRGLKN